VRELAGMALVQGREFLVHVRFPRLVILDERLQRLPIHERVGGRHRSCPFPSPRARTLSVCLSRSLARSLSHSSFEIRPSQKKKSTKFTESKQNNPFLEKPKLQCPRTSSSLFFFFFFFSSSSSFKQNSSQRLANNAGKFLGLNKQETGKNDLGTETSEVLTWGQKAQKF